MVNGSVTYYAYDEQNQLLESRSVGKTYTYTYDAAGNIQTASDGTTTHNYTYDTGVWKDLLKYFDGEEIVYDASGNPTTYYNGTEWNMTWAEGRRLVSASGDGKSLTFTYDSDGLRLTKKVGSTTYNYYYAGGKLLRQTDGTNTLDFFYDASGNPYALKYNNTLYYYITNLQGDVLHIVDTSGTPVVSYTYDPYGKLLSGTNSTLGNLNPLRFRGYVYDTETGMYYLQSRYYDPETGRFINADGYASTGQGIVGCNMFAYCNNNPIIYSDHNGFEPDEAVDVDGDGIVDYYVYTYTYTTGILFWRKQHTAYVYIYVGKNRSFFEDPSNHPENFSSSTDIMVGDFTNSSNPNMYAYRADLTKPQYREAILLCLLEYDEDFDTSWDRTLDSLLIEWREHKRYAWASARAKNVDFDNDEEGKGFVDFLEKAIDAVFN